jgi:hypothetical protein
MAVPVWIEATLEPEVVSVEPGWGILESDWK